MGWNHGAWGADDWFAMRFIMLVFWGLLAALVVWLAGPPPQRRRAAGVHRHESQDDGAFAPQTKRDRRTVGGCSTVTVILSVPRTQRAPRPIRVALPRR
jgi:hypothetical protein